MSPNSSLRSTPHLVDLFAGPGGLDVGAAWLGIPTVGIEIDANACATRTAAGLHTVQGDVRNYGPLNFPGATVLAGGPPCQTFTVAGAGSGRKALGVVTQLVTEMAEGIDISDKLDELEDDRTGLVLEPMRWILESLHNGNPYEAIVLEQVPAVLPVWSVFRGVLEKCGYSVAHGVLRTEEYGVPQTRRRAVLIARYGCSDLRLPTATHESFRKGSRPGSDGTLPRWISMADALGRESDFTVISNYGSGGDPRNRGRRSSDEPSSTITGKVMRNRLLFPDGNWDRFSTAEAGQLQSFPFDFPWSGKDIAQQIGNAIPPRLAAHLLASALGLEVDWRRLDGYSASPWAKSKTGGLFADPATVRRFLSSARG